MYEDDFLEMMYEDRFGYPEDPADFDARDFDDEEPFFDEYEEDES
jgi:hypothetical protein